MAHEEPLARFDALFADIESKGIYAENISQVRTLIDSGASPDAVSARGYPLTVEAVRAGKSDCLEFLLERGARVDEPEGGSGKSLLIWAASRGDVGCVSTLIAHGADVDFVGEFGMTALMHACWQGHAEAARMLVDAGADIEATDGATSVVHYAAQSVSPECLKLLADRGVSLDSRLESGGDAGHIAARNPRIGLLLSLSSMGLDLNRPDCAGKTALDIAEVNGLSDGHLAQLKAASLSNKEREELDNVVVSTAKSKRSMRV